jgi:KDO2-lipid IV(A) lauroyltransferase
MGTYSKLGAPIFGLYRPQKQKWVDDVLYWLRSQTGMSLLSTHQSLKETYRVLKAGKVLGNVGDQGQGLRIPFLGRETNFPEGPVRLAQKTGSSLLFYACIREGKYLRMKLISEIEIDSENLYNTMQIFVLALERLIQQHPEQYFWVHDIWKEFRREQS